MGGCPEELDRDSRAKLKRIAARYLEDIRTLGLGAAHEHHLHPDVTWCSVDGELTKAGMIHMGNEIHKFIVGPFNIIPGIMTAEDNRVAVEARSDIQMTNKTRYQNTYHFLFQFTGNQIIRVHEHYDSAHASKIWKPYAASLMAKATTWMGQASPSTETP